MKGPFMNSSRLWLAALVVGGTTLSSPAAVPTDPTEREKAVGQPAALEVRPAAVSLDGPRATQQVVVTGKYADGTIRDLTPFAVFTAEAADLLTVADGFVRGKRN